MVDKAQFENSMNFLMGIWLMISPFCIATHMSPHLMHIAYWNTSMTGVAIVILSALALRDIKPWEEWGMLGLGVWAWISPWMLGYDAETALAANNYLMGAAIVALSVISLPVAVKHEWR